jgi:hypothetical protein
MIQKQKKETQMANQKNHEHEHHQQHQHEQHQPHIVPAHTEHTAEHVHAAEIHETTVAVHQSAPEQRDIPGVTNASPVGASSLHLRMYNAGLISDEDMTRMFYYENPALIQDAADALF